MSEVIIYGKAGCPYTANARAAHPDHVYVDVKEDPAELEKMLKLSGGERKVPVIVKDGVATVGFDGT